MAFKVKMLESFFFIVANTYFGTWPRTRSTIPLLYDCLMSKLFLILSANCFLFFAFNLIYIHSKKIQNNHISVSTGLILLQKNNSNNLMNHFFPSFFNISIVSLSKIFSRGFYYTKSLLLIYFIILSSFFSL